MARLKLLGQILVHRELLVLEAGKVREEEVKLDSISCVRGLREGGSREPVSGHMPHTRRAPKASHFQPEKQQQLVQEDRSCLGMEWNSPPL